MELYTVQHREAFKQLQKTGVLHANEQYLFCEEDLRFAYDWLAAEMTKRIGPPPDGVRYPVWLWRQWEGKKPEIEAFDSAFDKAGTPLTFLKVELPDTRVLLSDFDKWHIVLNDGYLYLRETEEKGALQTRAQSWERIFDKDSDKEYWGPAEQRSIQATAWEFRKEDIRSVEHFVTGSPCHSTNRIGGTPV